MELVDALYRFVDMLNPQSFLRAVLPLVVSSIALLFINLIVNMLARELNH